MANESEDAALDLLLARAGLSATPQQKLRLKQFHPKIIAMAALVRTPRSHMAEPAHCYGCNEEDLP